MSIDQYQSSNHILTDGLERLNSFYDEYKVVQSSKIHVFSIIGPNEHGFRCHADRPGIFWFGAAASPEQAKRISDKWHRRLGGIAVYTAPQGQFLRFPDPSAGHVAADDAGEGAQADCRGGKSSDAIYDYFVKYVAELENQGRRVQSRMEISEPTPEYKEPEPTPDDHEIYTDEEGVTHMHINVPEMNVNVVDKPKKEKRYTAATEGDITDNVQNPYCVITTCYMYETYRPELEPSIVFRFEGAVRDPQSSTPSVISKRYKNLFDVSVCQYGTLVELIPTTENTEKRVAPDFSAMNAAYASYLNPADMKLVDNTRELPGFD